MIHLSHNIKTVLLIKIELRVIMMSKTGGETFIIAVNRMREIKVFRDNTSKSKVLIIDHKKVLLLAQIILVVMQEIKTKLSTL